MIEDALYATFGDVKRDATSWQERHFVSRLKKFLSELPADHSVREILEGLEE